MRFRFAVLIVLALTAVAGASCGGDSAPRPVSRQTPTRATTAAPAGDLLVYTRQQREESTGGRVFPVLEVVTYDIASQREISAFEIGGINAYPLQIVLAGRKIVANLESRIVSYDLDGSNEAVLRQAVPEGHFIGIAASNNGAMVAYTEQTGPFGAAQGPDGQYVSPYPAVTRLGVVSLSDGSEVFTIPQSDPQFSDYRGQLAIPTWRDDLDGLVVGAFTYSEAPGGIATVMLDGTARVHSFDGYVSVSPNGRFVSDDDAQLCDLGSPAENHEVRIVDLDTNARLASLHDDEMTVDSREWSPDGDELLIERYRLMDVNGSFCQQRDDASEWLILPATGAPLVRVSGPDEARQRWYEHPLRYACNGEALIQPYCQDAMGVAAPLTVTVDDTTIDDALNFQLVGFIEAG